MCLDRESEQPCRREHPGGRGGNRGEIIEIDENIGGEDEVIMRASVRLSAKKIQHVGHAEPIVEAFRARLCDHRRRQINTHQPIDVRAECGSRQAGPAAQVEHGTEAWRYARKPSNRIQQKCRPAIVEPFYEGFIEPRSLLIEQTTDIDRRHRWRGFARSQPRQLQSGAVVVLEIGVARPLPSGDRARSVAKIVADRAKREPSGGEGGCEFHRSPQNFGSFSEIAAGDAFESRPILPVGRGFAGRDEERATCHRGI